MERLTVPEMEWLARELEAVASQISSFVLGPADVAIMEAARDALAQWEPRRAFRMLTDLRDSLLREQQEGTA